MKMSNDKSNDEDQELVKTGTEYMDDRLNNATSGLMKELIFEEIKKGMKSYGEHVTIQEFNNCLSGMANNQSIDGRSLADQLLGNVRNNKYAKAADMFGSITKIGDALLQSRESFVGIYDAWKKINNEDISKYEYTQEGGKILSECFAIGSNFASFIPGPIGTIIGEQLALGAKLLDTGMKIVTKYIDQLDEYLKLLDESDDKNTVDILAEINEKLESVSDEEYLEYLLAQKAFIEFTKGFNWLNEISDRNKELIEYRSSFNDIESIVQSKINEFNEALGEITGEDVIGTENGLGSAKASIVDAYNEAKKVQDRKKDPVVLDLNGDGKINLIEVDKGVNFDLDCDGFKEKAQWIENSDGILVRDLNKDGIINNGRELFGDYTKKINGDIAINGFDALKDLDINNDNIIDSNDLDYSQLRVWVDKNKDGISNSDELFTLEQLKICGFKLDPKTKKMEYIKTDGSANKVEYVNLNVDKFSSTYTYEGEFSEEVTKLPNINGTGNVYSLRIVMEKNLELRNLVNEFIKTTDIISQREIVSKIILLWTSSTNIDVNSRGANIDARMLNVIEKFTGQEFVGENGSNPNVNASIELKKLYENLYSTIYESLLGQTFLSEYLPKLSMEYKIELGGVTWNFDELNKMLDDLMNTNPEKGANIIGQLSYFLRNNTHYNEILKNNFQKYADKYTLVGLAIAEININTFLVGGKDDNELIATTSNTLLRGMEGNDKLTGGSGADILEGGKGNDKLYGGTGNDTYVFNLGDGQDIIQDYDRNAGNMDTISFGEGILAENVMLQRSGNNIEVIIKGTEDKITIQNYFTPYYSYTSIYNVEKITFADGTNWDVDHIKAEVRNIRGTEADDTLNGYSVGNSQDETFYAGEGSDTVNAAAGNDIIYAGVGNDTVNGGDGADTIYGGKGNDKLFGDVGNDTYVFNLGDGQDIIQDYDRNAGNKDVLIFGKDVLSENVIINRKGNNLELSIEDTEDKITVENYFYNYYGNTTYYNIENITFADGATLTSKDILSNYINEGNNNISNALNILKQTYCATSTDLAINSTQKSTSLSSNEDINLFVNKN